MTSARPGKEAQPSSGGPIPWIENRPTRGRRALNLEELWKYRELIAFLALRDVKVRYKQAVFGGAWAIVQPLAGAAIFTVVFGRLAGVSSGNVPYIVLAFAGFSLWSYFSVSVNSDRESLVSNSSLITKVYFPRLAAPLASVFPGLIDLVVALVVLGAMMAWYGVVPGVAILTAPLFLAGAVIVAFGTGALFAALTVQYRDVQQIFGLVIQLWLFASPVAYPSTLVHGAWRWLYYVNPMAGVMDGWRWAVIGGPSLASATIVSAVTTLLVLVFGIRVFQRSESRFADVI